jgi:phage head maturation protease
MMRKEINSGEIKVLDKEKFISQRVISTEDYDRDNESVVFDSIDSALRNYRANPVVLWHHNMGEVKHPIGRNLDVRKVGNKIIADTQFAVEEDTSNFTRTLWNLHSGGYLNGASIGFKPGAVDIEDAKDWNSRRIVHVDELFEDSLTAIPANQAAVTAIAKALARDRICKGLCQHGHEPAKIVDYTTADAAIKALEREIKRDPAAHDRIIKAFGADLLTMCRELTAALRRFV